MFSRHEKGSSPPLQFENILRNDFQMTNKKSGSVRLNTAAEVFS